MNTQSEEMTLGVPNKADHKIYDEVNFTVIVTVRWNIRFLLRGEQDRVTLYTIQEELLKQLIRTA